jgi:hypothetical protein
MRLGVFGSRSIQDERVCNILGEFLNERPSFDTIVTAAEPAGVCALAQDYAKRNYMVLEVHFWNAEKRAAGAHEHRSKEVILASDFMLLIHDGESQGTLNELEQVKKLGRKFHYVIIPPTSEDTIPIQQKKRIEKQKNATRKFAWRENA